MVASEARICTCTMLEFCRKHFVAHCGFWLCWRYGGGGGGALFVPGGTMHTIGCTYPQMHDGRMAFHQDLFFFIIVPGAKGWCGLLTWFGHTLFLTLFRENARPLSGHSWIGEALTKYLWSVYLLFEDRFVCVLGQYCLVLHSFVQCCFCFVPDQGAPTLLIRSGPLCNTNGSCYMLRNVIKKILNEVILDICG